jgi:hypothetical protein
MNWPARPLTETAPTMRRPRLSRLLAGAQIKLAASISVQLQLQNSQRTMFASRELFGGCRIWQVTSIVLAHKARSAAEAGYADLFRRSGPSVVTVLLEEPV